MPDLTVRERQRLAREEAILDGAQEIMATRGYLSMTMDDLAAALNVSKATLYQHFRSKEELGVAVLTRIVERALAFVRSLDPATPPLARIESIISYAIQRRYGEGQLSLSNQVAALLPALERSARYQSAAAELSASLSDILDQAKSNGEVDPDLSTPVLVQALQGLVRNTNYQPLLDGGMCTVDGLKRTLTAFVLRGVRKEPSRG